MLGAFAAPAGAQVDQFMNNVVQDPDHPAGRVSDSKIGSGLREALRVAAEKAVEITGRADGFWSTAAIRIPLPGQLRAVEINLLEAGNSTRVEDFVLGMNRVAEQSAPAARRIFLDAIRELSFADARKVLGDADAAATAYFKARALDRLRSALAPVVRRNMYEVGVAQEFEALKAGIDTRAKVQPEAFDIDGYVTEKTLDGLFRVMGEQERRIRQNPAARSSALLKEVFAR